MKKHSYLVKILKSIYLNINHFLEKYLNKLNIIGNKNQKKPRSLINRLIITFLFIFFLGMSYLSIPNLYSKSKIKLEIENQISQRYDSTFLLSNNLNYRIFPVPHFEFLNSELFHINDKIADLINLKVFISFNNFFSNKINVKNIILDGANLVFEGFLANAYETSLTAQEPTQDRTITLPNVTGTVITTGNLTVDGTTTGDVLVGEGDALAYAIVFGS